MTFVELVQKAQIGDTGAYGVLVERFQEMAFGYAYHLLGDFHLAQDATQDAFLEGFRNVATMREPQAFPSWLRRVVFKHCDRLRRRKRFVTVPLEEGFATPDEAPLTDERREREEMRRLVATALDALTEEERAVTILSAIHRYRQKEIGAFLELPIPTVKNRFRSARRKLSERILEMTTEAMRQDAPSIHEAYAEIEELAKACQGGDLIRVTNLLQKHPDVLDSPDRDTRFPYPGSQLWAPLYLAAMNGHESLVRMLLDRGANPVPYEVAAHYHDYTYTDWLDTLHERGYRTIVEWIESAIVERYGPIVDGANLHQAVREGDVERTRALIRENPVRVRQVDAVGNTALHWAVAGDHVELTRLLVENGSPVDARNGDGRTPSVVSLFGFHRWWRREERQEILDFLLANGAQYTILIAASVGDRRRVQELLKEDPSLANYLDPCYRRPLSAASEKGHTEIVRLLLEHGADPNAKEAVSQGGYSLHLASDKGYMEVVRLLLEHGAAPGHWVDSSGDALFIAYFRGHKEIVQYLYAYGATMDIEVYANGHRIDVIAEMLKLQPSLADKVLPYGWDDNGSEELACDIMRLAIRYGARFEKANNWNMRWTIVKYPKVFRLLQEHGANPNGPLLGIAGDMSRRYASPEEQLNAVKFLVDECRAEVDSRNEEGYSTLALAAREGHGLIVDYLLSQGAQLNPDGPEWVNPLFVAEKRGHTAIAETLRRHSATA